MSRVQAETQRHRELVEFGRKLVKMIVVVVAVKKNRF